MSSAVSGSELLAARDRRQDLLTTALAAGSPSTLFLSLNIPGEEKSPEGAGELFEWGMKELFAALDDARLMLRNDDRFGPFAILSSGADPLQAKATAVSLESTVPAARLLDIDVYDHVWNQIGRREVGLPPRSCLLCPEAAADCIRLRRHDYRWLKARTDELLRSFHP